jgi:hypothetical protein
MSVPVAVWTKGNGVLDSVISAERKRYSVVYLQVGRSIQVLPKRRWFAAAFAFAFGTEQDLGYDIGIT